jgi:hypothetical protein
MSLTPPPEERKEVEMPNIPAELAIEGSVLESQPEKFLFGPRALRLGPPPQLRLCLRQTVRDLDMT